MRTAWAVSLEPAPETIEDVRADGLAHRLDEVDFLGA